MITYILETLVFQLVFLLTYDLFLKKETFFQWNRVYLLTTFVLSLILPWVKFEMLKTTMPQELGNVTIFLTQLDGVVLTPEGTEPPFWSSLPWYYWLLIMGSLVSALWFTHKLMQIQVLKRSGTVQSYPGFDKITVEKSTLAFSFFRNIFLGAEIKKEKEANIIAHELVHVKQRHTLDLLFFEIARILFWFNPLVYVYQNRMAELHEFIADAQVVKDNKREHFELLLSEAFKTQHISFVNQFFNKSLIKKRIVMLQKKRSKAIWQLKYVLLLPLVLGMLVYTSCETGKEEITEEIGVVPIKETVNEGYDGANNIVTLKVGDIGALTEDEKYKRAQLLEELGSSKEEYILEIVDRENRKVKIQLEKGVEPNGDSILISFLETVDKENRKVKIQSEKGVEPNDDSILIPFAIIDEVPVFPGCENAADKRACFQESIQNHIRKHFNYPQEAQEQGIQGRVSLIFIIGEDGVIRDIKKRGPHELLENEAVRIIERLPQMTPGKQQGEVVAVLFSIPITFKLK